MPQLAQLIEHADVVQRVNIATDQRRDTAGTGALQGIAGQQRWLWKMLFQVLDDRGRLHQQFTGLDPQGRYTALRVKGEEI
ncbi:hypothetical protein D3C86_1903070 [compost metagenome]